METIVKIKDDIANPTPLGLLGFGMTTLLLNLHNASIIPFSAVLISTGLFCGGLAQIVAGILEFKKNNTFGATAFTFYGFFWLSFVWIWFLPIIGITAPDNLSMGFYFLLWSIFTLCLAVCSLSQNKINIYIFWSLFLLFILLSIGSFMDKRSIIMIAGWEGILCGGFAFYSAIYHIMKEVLKKPIL